MEGHCQYEEAVELLRAAQVCRLADRVGGSVEECASKPQCSRIPGRQSFVVEMADLILLVVSVHCMVLSTSPCSRGVSFLDLEVLVPPLDHPYF